ncbi:MAG: SpoIIE family protein phosphatase [Acidobacteria bacterium]|nr:SpoIIE family protein phosphatase [Acidobacteriota bacterium]
MPNKVLVVDDEPDLEVLITQRFRKRIRAEQLSFLFASNGEDALAKLQADGLVDVVLTDINMPVMDGLTLLLRLREAHPLLRSVIVSAYGDMPNIRTALNRGAFDFITKPIDFEDLEITLDKAIREAVERKQAAHDRDRLLGLGRELELARTIQESLVPRSFPQHERLSVFGTMIPAAQVGGDLFDCFMLDNHRLAFTIGDVSGKGIAAALFMAVSRTVLRVAASKGLSPQACLTEAHQFLYGERRATSHFVTCFYGILDLTTGQLEYSRAGHNPPYLVRGNEVQTLDAASGLPLGMLRKVNYDTATVQLAPGDTLLLFTDGITEAMNPRQEEYGEERLVQMLSARASSLSVEELVRLVTQEAIAFAESAPASDDMTVLGVRYQ